MDAGSVIRGAASALYYGVWTHLRPRGYAARLAAALGERAPLEWTSPEDVWRRQQDKLNALLAAAAAHVPYYRRLAQEGRLPTVIRRPEDLAAVPPLTKTIIRREREALLSEVFPREAVHANATGGSTGEPLHFWSDDEAIFLGNVGEAWAASVAGLGLRSSVAMLWGAGRFERSMRKDFKEGLRRVIANRVFIDCFKMKEADLAAAHRRLSRARPEAVVGYSSALVELAQFLRRTGARPRYPRKAILSAAETLDPVSREILETTFGVPVLDRYGSREIGPIAMECPRHQGLHIDCENVLVELADDPGGSGLQRILVTKLGQFSMPLIRYDIEDLAEGPLAVCSCGRGYPVLKRIVGRVTEMIRLPDGGCLPGELFPHLFKDCGIAVFRVVQAADYSLDVALVRTAGQTEEQQATLRRVIVDHVGPAVRIYVRYVDAIDCSATGKLLPVISHAPRAPAGAGRAAT
jgi:phenylacetate-CoA ligase